MKKSFFRDARAWRWMVLTLVLLTPGVQAQQSLSDLQVRWFAGCHHPQANVQNSRQDIPVSTTPVTVLTAVASPQYRCWAVITNVSPAQPIRCAFLNEAAPTATQGYKITAGNSMNLQQEANVGVSCIRDTSASADSVVSVLEGNP